MSENTKTKNKYTALVLCWFLGIFGVHRFYTGRLTTGFFMLYCTIASIALLFVNIPLALMGFTIVGAATIYDFTIIAFGSFKDCYGNYVVNDKIN